MKRCLWIFSLMIFFLAGCKSPKENFSDDKIQENQKLVVYTAYSEEVYQPLIEEFEERTGLWVEVRPGGTIKLLEEVKKRQDCDVFFGGPLCLLEENDSLFRMVTAHSCTPIVLVYNTKLVKNSPPEGWADLLLPVWKGEIAFANPENSGSAYVILATLAEVIQGKEALQQQLLTNLDGKFLEFSRDVVLEVANGNYYIGVTLEETALRSVAQGYDISIVYPETGIVLTEGIAITEGSAQKENAERFVEFMKSADAMKYMEEHLHRHIPEENKEVAE